MRFISLVRNINDATDTSTLGISEKKPGRLKVIGILPHGAEIAPASVNDALELIEFLADWIATTKGGE